MSTTVTQNSPLVSIGLPVYNEEEHLAKTLDSLRAQDYENLELIICDNASTDATPRICAEYAAKDTRIRYVQNGENVGGIENFNRVFQLAKGEFFMWASGHDLRHPSQISACLELLLPDPAIVLCYTQVIWVRQDGSEIEKVHEYIDTRGVSEVLGRLNTVLWGLHGGFPIYGVFRTSALRKTSVYTQVFSPDMSLLIELSVLGRFAFRPDPPLLLRRARDYGSMEAYVAKHFRDVGSGFKAEMLFWRMLRQLRTRVCRHFKTLRGKTLAGFYVVVGAYINFHWMLEGLRIYKRRKNQPPDVCVEWEQGKSH